MQKKILIRFGILAVALIFAFIWGFSYLKGKNIFTTQNIYYAIYNDVDGLNIGTTIQYKGIKIGQIKTIEFSDNIGSQLVVIMYIDKNFKISKGSKAEIFNDGIMGSKGLRITYSDSTVYFSSGDTIPSSSQAGMIDEISTQLGPLKGKTENLVVSLDSIITVLHQLIVLNQLSLNSSINNINASLRNLQSITNSLDKMLQSPNGKLYLTVSEIQQISYTISQNQTQLDNTLKNLSAISDSLNDSNIKQVINQTAQTIANLNLLVQKVNSGQGTIGQAINDDSLYTKISNAVTNLDSITKKISENPKKYLKISIF